MHQYWLEFKSFFRKGDVFLLVACLVVSLFGCLVICSATRHTGSPRSLNVQLLAICIGVAVYVLVSAFDIGTLCEHKVFLTLACWAMLATLASPFGVDGGTGNRSWLDIPGVPVMIQPAEYVKIIFVLLLSSVLAKYQSRVSHVRCMLPALFQIGVLAGLNLWLSKDMGVTMIFVAIFGGMIYAGGVKWYWFAGLGGAAAAAAPFVWNEVFDQYQRNRIMIIFDETIDPLGLKERYHTLLSLRSLTGGGLSGQGLFQGIRTQSGALYAQHTDFIFSAIGEEMGYIGCVGVLVALSVIIIHIIAVGNKTPDYLRKLICYGVAAALIFQTVLNVGMCMGVMPIVGLTLPFISYGGSSMVSLFAMVGLVSGIKARPQRPVHELYVYAPIGMEIKEKRRKKREE